MFLHVSVILFTGVVVFQHALQVVSQHAWQQVSKGGMVSQYPLQVSRPTPKGGVQAHTRGVPAPGGYLLWGVCGYTPLMATAVGRTHSTGMHSCYNIFPKMDKNCHKIHKHYCQFYNPYSSILYFCHVMGSQYEIRY